jgi:hypothetical protein
MCIEDDEMCIEDDEMCIEDDEMCIEDDEMCNVGHPSCKVQRACLSGKDAAYTRPFRRPCNMPYIQLLLQELEWGSM